MPHRRDREEMDTDWAEQVPERRPRGPYRDYGWERGQSGLPEFRDPEVHRMPYDDDDEYRFRNRRGSNEYYKSGYGYDPSVRREQGETSGPYFGVGPRGYNRPPERIREDVCERLTRHGLIDASDIEVDVEENVVILKGTVDSRKTKRMAEDVAESVSGVGDVQNQLHIDRERSRSGRIDRVGESGVYPASGPWPKGDADVVGMAGWGQGERGAEGYYDSGESELRIDREQGDKKEDRE